MPITCMKTDGKGVVSVSGAMTAATAADLRGQLSAWKAQEPGVKNFIFDLSGVDLLDSAGLGLLMGALKRITERGGDLKIAGLQKGPRKVFAVTRADKVFELFANVAEAMASFR